MSETYGIPQEAIKKEWKLYLSGICSYSEIGKKYDITKQAVFNHFNRVGILSKYEYGTSVHTIRTNRRRSTKEEYAGCKTGGVRKIKKMLKDPMCKISNIAKEFRVNYADLNHYAKSHNIVIPRTHPKCLICNKTREERLPPEWGPVCCKECSDIYMPIRIKMSRNGLAVAKQYQVEYRIIIKIYLLDLIIHRIKRGGKHGYLNKLRENIVTIAKPDIKRYQEARKTSIS